jgi:anti-sigma factor RsiW
MRCSEFLERHSEYRDDESGTLPDREHFEAHLGSCPSCRRFDSVLSYGVALLRSEAEPELGEEFEDRLKIRLYLSDFERARRRSGRTAALPLLWGAAALLLLTLALGRDWMTERLNPAPVVRLPALVVAPTASPTPPASQPLTLPLAPEVLPSLRGPASRTPPFLDGVRSDPASSWVRTGLQ